MQPDTSIKGKVVRFCPLDERWSAPPGALAVVTGFASSYVILQWLHREDFGNHNQNDGGFYWEDIELPEYPITLEDLI